MAGLPLSHNPMAIMVSGWEVSRVGKDRPEHGRSRRPGRPGLSWVVSREPFIPEQGNDVGNAVSQAWAE